MHMLEPKELERRRANRAKKRKTHKHKRRFVAFIMLCIAIYSASALMAPLPVLQTSVATINLPIAQNVSMPWPSYGQATVGAVGYGLLASHGDSKPMPIASVAKVITAVAVLKARPIQAGSKGEVITLTAKDVTTYNKYLGEGQSAIAVQAGEKLTQYQALQALLLPSANNMADALVNWAFGSIDNYLSFVNSFIKTLGMINTHMADASGYSPQTVSTAVDLAKLAEIAMNQPAIAEIVAQPQADLPVAGTVYNVNNLVGTDGITGIKTGNTDEAGGCFMFSAKRKVDGGQNVTVVGVVLGAPDLAKALTDTRPLINETFKNFKVVSPIANGQIVGTISQPDGAQVPMKVSQNVQIVAWNGLTMEFELKSKNLMTRINSGQDAGSLMLYAGDMAYEMLVVAGGSIANHTVWWRLRHFGGRI